MSGKIIISFLLILSIKLYLSQNLFDNHRSLIPHPLYNTSGKHIKTLKIHSKLLQTVYSDSFSKNYYYTSLYIGHNKVRQTYILDTGSSIMSSPCSPCPDCGVNKNPYYYDINLYHKPLKCNTKICNLVPNTSCKKKKFFFADSCGFSVKRSSGDGIKGYYLQDIVYFETDKQYHNSPLRNKVYRSYALPIGCTTGEYGKFKELSKDGIMGLNNSPTSFISLLNNLKVINRNIFTLCFGLRGGYMSLGEVDNSFHRGDIQYVQLVNSNSYLVRLDSIKVGDNPYNPIKIPIISSVDTGNSISYFPSEIFKVITNHFMKYCENQDNNCGNFTYDNNAGYCASFSDRESLFKAVYHYWPNITLHFGESVYIWRPINYYYYIFNETERKACLGFNYHLSNEIILGSNFIHGHDIIFDRERHRIGFVRADCSRGNLIWNRYRGITGQPQFEITDPLLLDKELHYGEAENTFHLGDNNKMDMVDFVEGHNTELEVKEFRTLNFIIILISVIIIVIVIAVVLFVLMCGRKKLTYEQQQEESAEEHTHNEINKINTSDNNIIDSEQNRITFEESTQPETKLDDSK